MKEANHCVILLELVVEFSGVRPLRLFWSGLGLGLGAYRCGSLLGSDSPQDAHVDTSHRYRFWWDSTLQIMLEGEGSCSALRTPPKLNHSHVTFDL